MEAEFKRCQKSGRVLCLRHSTIYFREKNMCLIFQDFLLMIFLSLCRFFSFFFYFLSFLFPPILTDPWWKTNDLQYQKE